MWNKFAVDGVLCCCATNQQRSVLAITLGDETRVNVGPLGLIATEF